MPKKADWPERHQPAIARHRFQAPDKAAQRQVITAMLR